MSVKDYYIVKSVEEYLVEPSLDTLPVDDTQKSLIRQIADEYNANERLAKVGINNNNCILISGVYYQEVLYEAWLIRNLLGEKFNMASEEYTLTQYFANNKIYDVCYFTTSTLGYLDNPINIVTDFGNVIEHYNDLVPDFITEYKRFCACANKDSITIFLSTKFYPDINYLFDKVLSCDAKQGKKDSIRRTINYLNLALDKEVTKDLNLDKLLNTSESDLNFKESQTRCVLYGLSTMTIPTLDNVCKEVIKQNILYNKPINFKILSQCYSNYCTAREDRGF